MREGLESLALRAEELTKTNIAFNAYFLLVIYIKKIFFNFNFKIMILYIGHITSIKQWNLFIFI